MNPGPSLLAASVVVLAVAAGCSTAPPTPAADAAGTATATANASAETTATAVATVDPSALDDRLRGLYEADNRTAYAAAHGLRYADGRVEAVVELRGDATLPGGYDVRITARRGELAQARVAVEDLPALASEDGVRYVRPPRAPATDGPAEANEP